MATLTLTKVWLNLVSTGEAVSAYSTGRSQQYSMDGEVRTYAGGRQRFVGQEGEHGQFTVTLRLLSLAQVTQLRGWTGRTVLFRDRRGQLMYGVFTQVTPTVEWKDGRYDVELPLRLVTQDPGV